MNQAISQDKSLQQKQTFPKKKKKSSKKKDRKKGVAPQKAKGYQLCYRFGSLNVGALTGRVPDLKDKMVERNIDLICLSETKMPISKMKELRSDFTIINNGVDRISNGVAIMFGPRLKDGVVQYGLISDRIVWAKFKIGSSNGDPQATFKDIKFVVISIYAPQSGRTQSQKNEFWNQLTNLVSTFSEDYLFIGGDFNGHVGEDSFGFEIVHGNHGYGERNEDGVRLLEFATAEDLILTNTWFKKKEDHLITYTSGRHKTQIDFWLVRRPLRQCMTDVKVIRSFGVASQHKLLLANVRISKPTRHMEKKEKRIMWWKLRLFEQEFRDAVALDNQEGTAEEMWELFVETLKSAGKEVLGESRKSEVHPFEKHHWWNNEVDEAVREKKRLYLKWKSDKTDANLIAYKNQKNTTNTTVSRAKRATFSRNSDANTIEHLMKGLSVSRTHARNIEDKDGNILTGKTSILNRWSNHFQTASKHPGNNPKNRKGSEVEGPVLCITANEVEEAVQKIFKENFEPYDLPSKALWTLGNNCFNYLSTMFNKLLNCDLSFSSWTSLTSPVYKGKGSYTSCSSYNGLRSYSLSLLLWEAIIAVRLQELGILLQDQYGFSDVDEQKDIPFAVRIYQEKVLEKKKPLHVLFFDMASMLEQVPRHVIWYSLRESGVPEMYVQWIQLLYRKSSSKVKCSVGIGEPFPCKVGLHQGPLAVLLFAIILDVAMKDLSIHKIFYEAQGVMMSNSHEELQTQLNRLLASLKRLGMFLYAENMKYLEVGSQTVTSIKIGQKTVAKKQFVYWLGQRFDHDGNVRPEVQRRVALSWKMMRSIRSLLSNKRISDDFKYRIYEHVMESMVLKESEYLTITAAVEKTLKNSQLQMLHWIKRKPRQKIVDIVRERRRRWEDILAKKPNCSIVQKALNYVAPGKRPQGGQSKRWWTQK